MTDHALMTHVEKIVRPVRAGTTRQLRMRRELLAHLEAAVAEERAAGTPDADLLARATQRLGDPIVLTAQLQETVPPLERLLLTRFKFPAALNRWEARAEKEWAYATLGQRLVIAAAGGMGLVLLAGAAVPFSPAERAHFFALQHSDPARYVGGCLVAGTLVTTLALLSISMLVNVLKDGWRAKRVLFRAGLLVLLETSWTLTFSLLIANRTVGLIDAIRGLAAGLLVVTLQIGVTVLASHAANDAREWKSLEIGS